jgi:methylthioribose-1-phosphate isomerase
MPQHVPTLRWEGDVDGHLVLLDQTRLPGEVVELHCHTVEELWQAIKRLSVRGAPAIGVAAAYGVCLSLRDGGVASRTATPSGEEAVSESASRFGASIGPRGGPASGLVFAACDYLATSRPTAVNLFFALNLMRTAAEQHRDLPASELAAALLNEAHAIRLEDERMSEAIGRHGADLLADLPEGAGILTHCNAGALVTTGVGTALAVVYELARRGKRPHVWVDETRPLLQGARLTAWELTQRGIDCTLICDSMAAQVMREGLVQAVITGADRIAANGDTANKIGTYGVAVLAKAHDIPFYIAAPTSTFDLSIASGDEIQIEQRACEEITEAYGVRTAPVGVKAYNPAFDVTPAGLIRAIITENGAIVPGASLAGTH